MADAARHEGPGLDLARWFGSHLDDRWWEDLRPERIFGALRGLVAVEEFRDGDAMVVRAELPGIDPDKDVEISVHDGLLTIKGERTEEKTDEGTKRSFYRSEFRYGMFERTLPLPAGASESDVKATYKDGVLEVRVPLPAEQAATSKIRVERLS